MVEVETFVVLVAVPSTRVLAIWVPLVKVVPSVAPLVRLPPYMLVLVPTPSAPVSVVPSVEVPVTARVPLEVRDEVAVIEPMVAVYAVRELMRAESAFAKVAKRPFVVEVPETVEEAAVREPAEVMLPPKDEVADEVDD